MAELSLRQRLLLAQALVLIASLALGAWITVWQAAHLVRAEVSAALETGRRSLVAGLQEAGGAPLSREALTRLVSGFDGSRHVVAELVLADDTVEQSRPAPVNVASPAWFAGLVAPGLPADVIPIRGGALRLVPLPANETGERWSEARRLIALLALASALSAALCFATTAWSFRLLGPLAAAFERLGRGQQDGPVAATGPREIARLAAAFNRMQNALMSAARENRLLASQLHRLAEEERAELARDLHDEAGPLLFAITAWAAAAHMQAQAGDAAAAGDSLRSLEDTAAELQRAVRDLLRRLRDSAPASTDLLMSLQELVAFWRSIRPQTAFDLHIDEASEGVPEAAKAALVRVAQEAVSNAVRHGNPARVDIQVITRGNGVALTVRDDGTGGQGGDGYGITGMEERLQLLGGTLDIRRGRGWTVTAWAPLDPVPVG